MTTLHTDSWDQYAAICEQRIAGLEAEIERLRTLLEDACKVFDHYDLPEHAFHYRRILANHQEPKYE